MFTRDLTAHGPIHLSEINCQIISAFVEQAIYCFWYILDILIPCQNTTSF